MIDWESLRDTTGVLILLDICTELGMPESEYLASTKIIPEDLESPLANISVWQEMALIRNIQACRNSDEQLGLMVSKRCTAETMGMFGQALATSESLKQARKLMERYRMLGLAFSRFEFSSTGNRLSMVLHDVEVPADCQRFCEERGLGGCLSLFSDLLGRPLVAKSVSMRLPPPQNPQAYQDFFGVEVEFNAAVTEIVFERSIEDTPLPRANRKMHLASIRYCDEVIESQAQSQTWVSRVTAALKQQGLTSDIDLIAQQFGIGSRQLRRYLSEESSSFRAIQLSLKFSRAQALLASGMKVNEVALELGYNSPASFSRAYKKHTGEFPSAHIQNPV